MIQANMPVRLLVISDPGPSQDQVIAALSSQDEFQLVNVIASVEKLIKEIHVAEPDLIIGHRSGQPTLDVIDDMSCVSGYLGDPTIDQCAQQVTLAGNAPS
jgi:hypothetical protein